jgi:mRNA-degrading endonuclease RelE of RelBE toxin-antitoxin system
VTIEVTRAAEKEFDRWDEVSQAQFISTLQDLAERPDVVLGKGVRHLKPDQRKKSGADYYIKAALDRVIYFNRDGNTITIVHLSHRANKALGATSEW